MCSAASQISVMSWSMIRMVRPWAAMRSSKSWKRLLLGGVEAGGGLVEQQHGRVGGKRPRDLDQALVAIAERRHFSLARAPSPTKASAA